MKKTNRTFNSANVSFKRGDICRFENTDEFNCTSKSIVLILTKSKRYTTYLCVSNFHDSMSDEEFNVLLDKNDLEEIYNKEELFDGKKYINVFINQIKTNKNSVIQEVYASAKDNVLKLINEKLRLYLCIEDENNFESYEDISSESFNVKRTSEKIYLSESEKMDLIQNYSNNKKEYYSQKYGIPLEKIAQKVSSLKSQYKKKRKDNGLL